jgi:membrane protease YdiL (CAAX protease family)
MSETIVIAPAEKADRPIRGFDLLLAVLTVIGVTFIVGGVLGVLIGILWGVLKFPGSPIEALQTDFNLVVGFTTFLNAIILVLLFAVAKRFTKRPIGYFFPRVPASTIVKAALSAAAFMLVCVGIEAALKYGWHISLNVAKTEEAMTPKTWSQLGIVLVCFAAFVPFYEEYLFRGFVFGWLRRVMPVWIAVIISAAVFAAVHGLFFTRGGISGWLGTGEIFVLGCLMAWWVARTGSLTPSYVVHLVNNGLAFPLAFLMPNLP